MKYIIFLSAIILFLSGCGLVDKAALKLGYENKTATEIKLTELQKEHVEVITEKTKEVEEKYSDLLNQTKSNYQQSSNWIYGASLASDLKFDKNRLDDVLDYRIKTAVSYSLAPTQEALVEQNRLLKEELDENKVSNEELATRYGQIQEEAVQAQNLLAERDAELIRAQQERLDLESQYMTQIGELKDQLILESNKIIDLEKARADDRKAIQAAKLKASFVLGGFAIAALAGAIYSPIGKDKCAIFSGILGAAAVGVWYIQPWMIGVGVCGALLLVVGIILYSWNREKIKARGSMWTIQKIRETNPEVHENVAKKELKDWFNESISKEIETDLQDMNATYTKK